MTEFTLISAHLTDKKHIHTDQPQSFLPVPSAQPPHQLRTFNISPTNSARNMELIFIDQRTNLLRMQVCP